MSEENAQDAQNVPSSWNYGSFNLHSRLYTSFMNHENDAAVMHPKYVPLNSTSMGLKSKVNSKLPANDTPRTNQRRASKIDKVKDGLRMENIEPRKVFTSNGWQRTNKSVEWPKNKIASEEYYRALKSYKEVSKGAKQLEMLNAKAMSFLLAGMTYL